MPLLPVWTIYLDMKLSVLKTNPLKTETGRAFSSQQHHCVSKYIFFSENVWPWRQVQYQSLYLPWTLWSDHRRYKIFLKLWDEGSSHETLEDFLNYHSLYYLPQQIQLSVWLLFHTPLVFFVCLFLMHIHYALQNPPQPVYGITWQQGKQQ